MLFWKQQRCKVQHASKVTERTQGCNPRLCDGRCVRSRENATRAALGVWLWTTKVLVRGKAVKNKVKISNIALINQKGGPADREEIKITVRAALINTV